METNELFSRQEALEGMGGRTAKRAYTLLFLIENQTLHLAAQTHQTDAVALTVAGRQRAPQPFLEAMAQARGRTESPAIQDLERFASHWAALVPENPEIRASVAHLLGQRYAFAPQSTRGVGSALGLDRADVQAAYQRLYAQPLAQIYTTSVAPREQVRWGWAGLSRRLESMPPYWLAFLLTVPGAAGLLALPISLAQVGTFWGLALILGFGLINLLTATALAETVVRSGTARFGLGFLGQLAHEYLGREASVLLTIVLAANNFLVLIIFFLGVAGTLGGASQSATTYWLFPIFAVVLYVLARRSLNTTVAVTLLIVFINLLILLLIPALVLPAFRLTNLLGGSGTAAFTPAALGSLVGVLSSTFLSHFVVATYGPVVLSRDPSGSAWIQGSASALLVYIVIACLWLLVSNGVLSPAMLSGSMGTVVTPLAQVAGPAIHLLGSLLMILSVGLTAMQVALGLYYLVEERLPTRGSTSWIGQWGENQRFVLAITPVLVALVVTLWLAISGMGSFTTLLGIVSVFTLPLVTGILPLLLLVSTRRKGDFAPGFVVPGLGHPVVVTLLYLFFIGSILIHGFYIWTSPLLRLAALVGGLVVVVVTWRVWRQGLLAGRVVIELRHDERLGGTSQVQVVGNGQPWPVMITLHHAETQAQSLSATVPIPDFRALRTVTIHLPDTSATHLKLWLHHLTPAETSLGIPAHLIVTSGETSHTLDASPEQAQWTLPLPAVCQIEIQLVEPASAMRDSV